MFKQRAVKKQYHALVDGKVKGDRGTIDNALGKICSYQGQSVWGEVPPGQGLPARTDWEVVARGADATLLLCRPMTGRTHQIRVHLSGMGHPILGDSQYGKTFTCAFRPQRCMLHASELAFEHPVTGKEIAIHSPLPEDFKEAIARVMEGK
jgi:23S rRNA-/tRNA-specific pseudouridylate synthase